MSETHPALLPNGLKDLLPPEADEEARIITRLLDGFSLFGYMRVKPPLVEFEETLLAEGPGQSLARNTFRLMDPVSQQMMGVRADTTAQIARIAGSRLRESVRPLRLSYAADVLRVNASQLRTERQFCQVGAELIGATDTHDDIEIVLMALKGLSDIGVESLSVDLTIPTLLNILFESFKAKPADQELIVNLIQKRDRDGLVAMKSKLSVCLVELLDCSGIAENAIDRLKKIKLPKPAKTEVKALENVYEGLLDALKIYDLKDIQVTIDLIEWRGFSYLEGVSFTLFAPHVRGELGRGGRYFLNAQTQENATGFTLYMDSVRQAVTFEGDQEKVDVPPQTGWEEIKKLQDQGFAVTRKPQ